MLCKWIEAGGFGLAGYVVAIPAAVGCAAAGSAGLAEPPRAVQAAVVPAPALDAGDRLKVLVFDEPALSGEFEIAPDGTLPMPLLGQVPVRGATPLEIQQRIAELLRGGGFVNAARVTVSVAAYRPFYVLGEVNQPGEYPFRVGLTAANAVATAQGFTYRANRRNVFVRRAGSGVEVRVPLTAGLALMPGDTLRIGERLF